MGERNSGKGVPMWTRISYMLLMAHPCCWWADPKVANMEAFCSFNLPKLDKHTDTHSWVDDLDMAADDQGVHSNESTCNSSYRKR